MPESNICSLSELLQAIKGHDELEARWRATADAKRQELLSAVRERIAAGELPDDPIATYVTLFMGNASPESQAALTAKLREIDAALRQHPSEPVLLVQQHHRTLERPSGCFHEPSISDQQTLHLGFLDGGGLIFDFTDPCKIALSTTKHFDNVIPGDDQVKDGPMLVPDHLLGSLLDLGLGDDAKLVIGHEAVMQYGNHAVMSGNVETFQLMGLLGASLPDPTD
jgi:hypothetical protein